MQKEFLNNLSNMLDNKIEYNIILNYLKNNNKIDYNFLIKKGFLNNLFRNYKYFNSIEYIEIFKFVIENITKNTNKITKNIHKLLINNINLLYGNSSQGMRYDYDYILSEKIKILESNLIDYKREIIIKKILNNRNFTKNEVYEIDVIYYFLINLNKDNLNKNELNLINNFKEFCLNVTFIGRDDLTIDNFEEFDDLELYEYWTYVTKRLLKTMF